MIEKKVIFLIIATLILYVLFSVNGIQNIKNFFAGKLASGNTSNEPPKNEELSKPGATDVYDANKVNGWDLGLRMG